MARPSFRVKHLLACLNAPWDGSAGPNTSRSLEGVAFAYRVPPHAEPPFEWPEFWLFTRLYRDDASADGECRLRVQLVWHDAPAGVAQVWTRDVTSVRLTVARPVVDAAWAFRPVEFPGVGLYEFRLRSPGRGTVAREFIRIERGP